MPLGVHANSYCLCVISILIKQQDRLLLQEPSDFDRIVDGQPSRSFLIGGIRLHRRDQLIHFTRRLQFAERVFVMQTQRNLVQAGQRLGRRAIKQLRSLRKSELHVLINPRGRLSGRIEPKTNPAVSKGTVCEHVAHIRNHEIHIVSHRFFCLVRVHLHLNPSSLRLPGIDEAADTVCPKSAVFPPGFAQIEDRCTKYYPLECQEAWIGDLRVLSLMQIHSLPTF